MTKDKDALLRKAKIRQYFAVCLVNLLGISMGTSVGWTSPMQPILTSPDTPIGTEPIPEGTFALLGSISFISGSISTVFWSRIADRIGRKKSLLLVAVPYILTWTFTLLAQNAVLLLVARCFCGFGIVGTCLIVPVYVIEIAQMDLRGLFGSFLGLTINAGILIPFALGPYIGYHALALLCLAIPVAFILIFIWLPETPVFSLMKGKSKEAEQSLLWYLGGDVVKTELMLSEFKCAQDKETNGASLKSLVSSSGRRKALFLGISGILAIQCTGIFPIFNFVENIFHMSGTSLSPNQSSVVIAFIQLVASCFCSVSIERIGRKPLLLGSLIGIAISLLSLGTYIYFMPIESSYRWIPLVSLSLHVTAYSLGGGTVIFIVINELFPSDVRCFGFSLMHLLNGVLGFFAVTFFPDEMALLQPHGCFLLHGFCCLLFSLLFQLQLPETKGKSEAEIMKALNGSFTLEDMTDASKHLNVDLDSTTTSQKLV